MTAEDIQHAQISFMKNPSGKKEHNEHYAGGVLANAMGRLNAEGGAD